MGCCWLLPTWPGVCIKGPRKGGNQFARCQRLTSAGVSISSISCHSRQLARRRFWLFSSSSSSRDWFLLVIWIDQWIPVESKWLKQRRSAAYIKSKWRALRCWWGCIQQHYYFGAGDPRCCRMVSKRVQRNHSALLIYVSEEFERSTRRVPAGRIDNFPLGWMRRAEKKRVAYIIYIIEGATEWHKENEREGETQKSRSAGRASASLHATPSRARPALPDFLASLGTIDKGTVFLGLSKREEEAWRWWWCWSQPL